jgi:Big-like domain-containing protein
MVNRWLRASLALGIAGATFMLAGSAASAATVTATDDAATTTMGNAVAINVTANDTYETGATSVTVDAPAKSANGSVTASGGTLTYTPNVGFTGNDTIDYTLCAAYPNGSYGGGSDKVCDPAKVMVTVKAAPAGSGNSSANTGTPGAQEGSGGSLPTTGGNGVLLTLLGAAFLVGGIACYGSARDPSRALVR